MTDSTQINQRLNSLYTVMESEGYSITLQRNGGLCAHRVGGHSVSCGVKLIEYAHGTISASELIRHIVGWEAYIARIANEIEDYYADVEEDLAQSWDQVRAEIASAK